MNCHLHYFSIHKMKFGTFNSSHGGLRSIWFWTGPTWPLVPAFVTSSKYRPAPSLCQPGFNFDGAALRPAARLLTYLTYSTHIIQTGQTPGSNIFWRRHSISPLKPRGYIFVQLRYISTTCNTSLWHFIT